MRALLVFLLLGSAASPRRRAGRGRPSAKLRLATQHEQAASPALNARQWLFAADNDAANLAGALLDSQAASWLADTQRVYLADIHKMPALIARMVALPPARQTYPSCSAAPTPWPCCRATAAASACWTSSSKNQRRALCLRSGAGWRRWCVKRLIKPAWCCCAALPACGRTPSQGRCAGLGASR